MKRLIAFAVVLFGVGTLSSPAYAGTFMDDFNDGNADGWQLGYSLHSFIPGNWRIEDGALVQNIGADEVFAVLNNYEFSDQIVSVDVKSNAPQGGYGGLILWFKDDYNWVITRIYPVYRQVWVQEAVGGVETYAFYPAPSLLDYTWHKFKIDVNSTNGEIKIFLDGNYLLTHNAITLNRLGRSGVENGNSGAYFDNFNIISDVIPEPLISKDQCNNDGWGEYTNPIFKNQGQCVSYLERNK
jgi:hypothetical protein